MARECGGKATTRPNSMVRTGRHGRPRPARLHRQVVQPHPDLIDKYDPDPLYFDDGMNPLGEAGMNIFAHFYNANIQRHRGKLEAVSTPRACPNASRSGSSMTSSGDAATGRTVSMANRHLHRRMALSPLYRLSEREGSNHGAGRHRMQERQSAAEHPGAGRWHHRRTRSEIPRRHDAMDGH